MQRNTRMIVSAVLALAMIFSLTACGQSSAAKAADALIAAIGEVGLESGDAITAAEEAVAALEEKDRESLKNLQTLTQAREAFNEAVDLDKISAVESLISEIGTVTTESKDAIVAAREAFDNLESRLQDRVSNAYAIASAEVAYADAVLTSEASLIEKAISDIGTVTLDSLSTIDAAKALYDEAPADVQAKVGNVGVLDSAYDTYAALCAKEVEDLINAIGEVTLDSGNAIDAAKAALKALSERAASKVTNTATLDNAEAVFKQLNQERAESLLGAMTLHEDKIGGYNWYYPSGWSWYSSDTWAANKTCFILPYMGIRPSTNTVWLRTVFNYTDYDWVFWKKVTIVADGTKYTKSYSYFDIVRNNSGGKVWEYYDDAADYDMLRAIAESEETLVRFSGDNYSHDYTVTATDKKAMQQALEAYDTLVASGYTGY